MLHIIIRRIKRRSNYDKWELQNKICDLDPTSMLNESFVFYPTISVCLSLLHVHHFIYSFLLCQTPSKAPSFPPGCWRKWFVCRQCLTGTASCTRETGEQHIKNSTRVTLSVRRDLVVGWCMNRRIAVCIDGRCWWKDVMGYLQNILFLIMTLTPIGGGLSVQNLTFNGSLRLYLGFPWCLTLCSLNGFQVIFDTLS